MGREAKVKKSALDANEANLTQQPTASRQPFLVGGGWWVPFIIRRAETWGRLAVFSIFWHLIRALTAWIQREGEKI